jgi:deoxyribodipyrimidine photolyase-related protein
VFLTGEDSVLFHSGISPMLNVGMLIPKKIIGAVEKHGGAMNDVEGFIRQILGWREFCRLMYVRGRKKANYFNATKRLNSSWYKGTTGIAPVDCCIKKAFRFGYLHHIERLMVVANAMVLSGIKPSEMYKWFMEFSLDSYDWVMDFNIYSMASYSDGGQFTTKPYISSSNYIVKMSNYEKGEWCKKWDGLFWSFMNKHKHKIKKIYRLAPLLKHLK